MTGKDMNNMELFNEITFLLCVAMSILFSDIIVNPYTKYNIGWLFLSLTALNLLINWLAMVKYIYS